MYLVQINIIVLSRNRETAQLDIPKCKRLGVSNCSA